MKILFLDIDGVLNCDTTEERVKGRGIFTGFMGIDRRLLKLYLNWLKARPDISVVLSSTWRQYREAMDELEAHGINWISTTPRSGGRSWEIETWLASAEARGLGVKRYVILDDLDLFSEEQLPYFVQTNPRLGVTEENLKRIDEIFDGVS